MSDPADGVRPIYTIEQACKVSSHGRLRLRRTTLIQRPARSPVPSLPPTP